MDINTLLSNHSTSSNSIPQPEHPPAKPIYQSDMNTNTSNHISNQSQDSSHHLENLPPTISVRNDIGELYSVSSNDSRKKHRASASDLLKNLEELSTSFITSTQPPLGFDEHSYHSQTSSSGNNETTFRKRPPLSTSHGNDHNIWANSVEDDEEDEQNISSVQSDYSRDAKTSQRNHLHDTSFLDRHLKNQQQQQRHNHERLERHHYSGPIIERSVSPGQYFGARSLPLECMDDLWRQHSPSPYLSESGREPLSSSSMTGSRLSSKKQSLNQYRDQTSRSLITSPDISYTSSGLQPLWKNYKALPSSLYHRHQWNRWEIRQQRSSGNDPSNEQSHLVISSTPSRSQSSIHNSSEMEYLIGRVQSLKVQDRKKDHHQRLPLYSLHPQEELTIRCQVSSTSIHTHDGHLTLANESTNRQHLTYSLFSANGEVVFDKQSGTVAPGQIEDIWIRPRKRTLQRLMTTDPSLVNEFVALLVDQDFYRLKVQLDITTDDLEQSESNDEHTNRDDDDILSDPDNRSSEHQEPCPFCLLENLYPPLVE